MRKPAPESSSPISNVASKASLWLTLAVTPAYAEPVPVVARNGEARRARRWAPRRQEW